MLTAKKIEKIVNTGALHTLYRKDGSWYHNLKRFPGVLFDINGYISFSTQADYYSNKFLNRGKELTISTGIKSLPGYKEYTSEEKKQIMSLY